MIVVFLAIVALVGVVVALETGRSGRSPARPLALPRYWWLLVFAVVPQVLWARDLSHLPAVAERLAWLVPLSYLPVFAFLLANLRFTWARLILLGAGLNLAVILANGGTMPARAVNPGDFASSATSPLPHLVPGSKDRVPGANAAIFLNPLADRYVVVLPGGAMRIVSVGDCVVLVGAVLALLTAVRGPADENRGREAPWTWKAT